METALVFARRPTYWREKMLIQLAEASQEENINNTKKRIGTEVFDLMDWAEQKRELLITYSLYPDIASSPAATFDQRHSSDPRLHLVGIPSE